NAGNGDTWRRLMVAADKNKDQDLAGKSLQWILQSQQQGGRQPDYASYIGDVLDRLELKDQASEYWKIYLTFDIQHAESRECAQRLLKQLDESQHAAFLTARLSEDTPFQGRYATWLADLHLVSGDLQKFAEVI